jgi:Flp pilus assembly protein TadG
VMVALLMVPLLVCSALAVDVGALYVERRQLQNAADAAALAIAQDCASARVACTTMASTATTLAHANAGSGASAAPVRTGNTVTVTASATVNYVFAPVIGIDSKSVTAKSTASWGAPIGGPAMLPIAFSWCAFTAQTANGGAPAATTTAKIIYLPKTDATACTGPSGNPVPGGFGWLRADSTGCTATSSIFVAQVFSDPGRSVPHNCSTADFVRLQNKTVLLPVYDTFGLNGSSAWYHIYAYAAFRITGYSFGGQYKWPQNPPCNGNDSCIAGYFTVFVEPSEAFTYGTGNADLGARLVKLSA